MKKLFKTLALGLMTALLLCSVLPAAFAAEDDSKVYLISLDPAGGVCSTMTVYTNSAGRLSALPDNPTMEGYTFEGWYTDPVDGDKITTSRVFDGDTTIYAHWTVKAGSAASGGSQTITTLPTINTNISAHLGTVIVVGIALTALVLMAF